MLPIHKLLFADQFGATMHGISLDKDGTSRINNFNPAGYSVIRHTGATGAFDFTGIAAPASGDEAWVIVYFASGYDVTIKHRDTHSTAGNRINTFQHDAYGATADAVIKTAGIAWFIYDITGAEWLLTSYIGT